MHKGVEEALYPARSQPHQLIALAGGLIAVIIALASLLAWDDMRRAEAQNRRDQITRLAQTLARTIDSALQVKATALDRMAGRWETAGGTPRRLWEADAQAYVADHGFASLNWVDADGILRWSVFAPDHAAPAGEALRLAPLAEARMRRHLVFSRPLEMANGNTYSVAAVRALHVDQRLAGYLVAYVPLAGLLEKSAAATLPAHAQAALTSGNRLLASIGSGPPMEPDHPAVQPLLLPGMSLRLAPEANFLAADASHLPAAVLGTGLVVALLLGSSLWFWQTAALRDRESEAANARLRDREARLAAIVDTAVEGIIIIDERGIVESINPAAERLFGYAGAEVCGRNVSMLMPEPYRSEHDRHLQRYLGGGEARVIGVGREVVGQRKNGETFPMDLAVSEMRVNGRRMFAGLARDISERKQMEKMKAEFVSVVSHELRTPLTSIAGALGLVASGALGDLPGQNRQMIEVALNNSGRLTHLINDLLDMEKVAAGKMQFDLQCQPLKPLVLQALEGIRGYADRHRVRLTLQDNLPDEAGAKVDANRLRQILDNLLSNAIKFSPAGGQVEVAASRNGERLRVAVTDHGPGIPAEFRSRIFDKFSQADSSDKRKTGGSGLGLAIAKELAEGMHGSLGFVSEAGQGACFYVEFPALETTCEDSADPFATIFAGGSEAAGVEPAPSRSEGKTRAKPV